MIKIDFFVTPKGKLLGFNINGHANFEDIGKDIVCASVSSVAYMVANTITDVIKVQATVYVNNNFYLKISENDANTCRDILLGLKLHLLGLEEQYPENIKVNYMEVQSND